MDETVIRDAIQTVGSGGVSRRRVVRGLAALGVAAPAVSALLGPVPPPGARAAGVEPKAGPRGGGGPLRMLFWQMYYAGPPPDPLRFMERFTSWRIPSKATGWLGNNVARWRDDGYDTLWRAARSELDPARRAALFIRMNDLVVASGAVIPVVRRALVEAVSRDLQVEIPPWGSPLGGLATWHRRA
jgi:ABC-type transport system substrate-binding protein